MTICGLSGSLSSIWQPRFQATTQFMYEIQRESKMGLSAYRDCIVTYPLSCRPTNWSMSPQDTVWTDLKILSTWICARGTPQLSSGSSPNTTLLLEQDRRFWGNSHHTRVRVHFYIFFTLKIDSFIFIFLPNQECKVQNKVWTLTQLTAPNNADKAVTTTHPPLVEIFRGVKFETS